MNLKSSSFVALATGPVLSSHLWRGLPVRTAQGQSISGTWRCSGSSGSGSPLGLRGPKAPPKEWGSS